LPTSGKVFISVRQADRTAAVDVAKMLIARGFEIVATRGTAKALQEAGLAVAVVNKVTEGRPNIVDMIKNDEIVLIVNTSDGAMGVADSFSIRREALMHRVAYTTTVAGAEAMAMAMDYAGTQPAYRIQDLA
jgi:carbamoyl-phosphate synthase large subunit